MRTASRVAAASTARRTRSGTTGRFDEYDFRRFDIVGSQFFSVAPKRRRRAATRSQLRQQRARRSRSVLSAAVRRRRRYGAVVPRVPLPRRERRRLQRRSCAQDSLDGAGRRLRRLSGKVAHDWQDINLTRLEARVWIWRAWRQRRQARICRLDVATAADGTRVFLKFTPVLLTRLTAQDSGA